MGSSFGGPASNARLSRPVLKRVKGWLGLDGPASPSWDTATLAPEADSAGGEPCVLVVDGSSFNRRLAGEMLVACGVKPLLAADGPQAVALAREVRFDLILMELQLPLLDGRAATRQIRREQRALERARVPVVAYTAAPLRPGELKRDGFDGRLDKPCHAQALRACLREWGVRARPEADRLTVEPPPRQAHRPAGR